MANRSVQPFLGDRFVKRFALHYRTVVCRSVLSVYLSVLFGTLVYCDQTVRRIKVKLGTQLGLSPGHIVLDADQASPQGAELSPNFRPMSVVPKRLDGSRCHLVRR